jgi:hypothetical protein
MIKVIARLGDFTLVEKYCLVENKHPFGSTTATEKYLEFLGEEFFFHDKKLKEGYLSMRAEHALKKLREKVDEKIKNGDY